MRNYFACQVTENFIYKFIKDNLNHTKLCIRFKLCIFTEPTLRIRITTVPFIRHDIKV